MKELKVLAMVIMLAAGMQRPHKTTQRAPARPANRRKRK